MVLPIARRAGLALLTLLVVTTLVFALCDNVLRFTYARFEAKAVARETGMDYEEAFRQAREQMGLTYNAVRQRYIQFLGGLTRGNLGESSHYGPITPMIAAYLPWTVLVLSVSLFLSLVMGGLLGAVAAWKRDTIVYPAVTLYAAISAAIPNYLTALVLLVILGINLKLFPTRGAYDSSLRPGLHWPFIKSVLHHAALPITAYTFTMAGTWTLVMKGSAVSVLGEDYVMAARARGLKERRIITAYVGRNAALPLVTRLAVAIANILGSAPFIDTTLAYPGLGSLFDEAVKHGDFVLMQGIFFVIAAAVVLANLGTDLLYSALDPRIRLGG